VQARDYPYTHSDAEYQEMWELLVESYAITRKPHNWLFARLENWKYASLHMPAPFFTRDVHLWRDSADRLVGFTISEHGDNGVYLQIHPEHRAVETDMLSWIAHGVERGKECAETHAYTDDGERSDLLRSLGYRDQGNSGNKYEYDTSQPAPEPALPPGYYIRPLGRGGKHDRLIELENKVFGQSDLGDAWFYGKASAPSYSHDWHLIVVSPDGEYVAFALVWVDARNRIAEIDPVGTHPDHRRKGLAGALLNECFRRLQACGVRRAYIDTGPDPFPANRLYESLGPAAKYQEHQWVKPVD